MGRRRRVGRNTTVFGLLFYCLVLGLGFLEAVVVVVVVVVVGTVGSEFSAWSGAGRPTPLSLFAANARSRFCFVSGVCCLLERGVAAWPRFVPVSLLPAAVSSRRCWMKAIRTVSYIRRSTAERAPRVDLSPLRVYCVFLYGFGLYLGYSCSPWILPSRMYVKRNFFYIFVSLNNKYTVVLLPTPQRRRKSEACGRHRAAWL